MSCELAVIPVLVPMVCSLSEGGGDVFRRALTGCRDRYLARQGPYYPFSRLLRDRQKCLPASAQAGAEHAGTGGRYVQPDAVSGWGRTGIFTDYAGAGQNYPHDAASDWQAVAGTGLVSGEELPG